MVIVWARNFPKATRDHFLELIIFRATAKLANIHNRLTTFLYKNSFFFQNSTLKEVALYFLGMGVGDYCAVYGCSSDRRKPDKTILMDHVGKRMVRS